MEEIKLNLIDFIKDTIIKLTLDNSITHIRDSIDNKEKSLLYIQYSIFKSIDTAIETSINNLIEDNTFKAYLIILKIIENNNDLNVINIIQEFQNEFDDFELYFQFLMFIINFLGLFEINRLHPSSLNKLEDDLLKKLNI